MTFCGGCCLPITTAAAAVRTAPLIVFAPSRLIPYDGGGTVSSSVNVAHVLLVLTLVYVPSAENAVVLVKYSGAGCGGSNHEGDARALKGGIRGQDLSE